MTGLLTPPESPEPGPRPAVPPLQPRKVRSRIRIPSASALTLPTEQRPDTVSQEIASPSAYNSGSPLSAQLSTPASSVLSGEASGRSTGSVASHRPYKPQENVRNGLPVITEVPATAEHSTILADARPEAAKMRSIMTAEKVAAVKVFIETHYSSPDFGRISPRSMRRHNLEEKLFRSGSNVAIQEEYRQKFFQAESDHLRLTRGLKSRDFEEFRGISVAGYEPVRVLGKGSFGVVRLVKEKTLSDDSSPSNLSRKGRAFKGAVFAMKVIRKTEMLRNCQEAHLRAERDFLVSCAATAKWIVPLVASFQDLDNLYLILEYQIGGDFLGYLLRKQILQETAAQWYVAEMILCVEETHRMHWIHRDIKPDNFLIASDGHLKISDFGLAFDGHWAHKQSYYDGHRYSLLERFGVEVQGDAQDLKEEREQSPRRNRFRNLRQTRHGEVWSEESRFRRRKLARSVVGTSQYMAPEVVRGWWYDGRCDWWSIGIILFECLWGYTPFSQEDREQTKRAIDCHQKYNIFEDPGCQPVSSWARDLIWLLLQEPDDRLGSRKYKANNRLQYSNGNTEYASCDSY